MNSKLKKTISSFAFSLCCIALMAFSDSETRDLADFNQISVATGVSAVIEKGSTNKIEIEVDNIDIKKVTTKIKNGRLTVKIDQKWWSNIMNKKGRKVKVHITYSDELDYIGSSSGSSVKSEGVVRSNEIKVGSSSGSTLKLELDADNVEADVSSGSTMVLSGSSADLDLDVSSGSTFNGSNLKSENVDADASSGASAKIWVTGKLKADASSGSSIRYKGEPTSKNIDKSSGASVSGN